MWFRRIFHSVAPLCALMVPLALAAQTVPATVNYQGRLTDNTPQQNPITATVPMAFAIYDAASAGTLLWSEPASGGINVPVTNGIFSVALGASVAIPATVFTGASSTRYLEITLNPGASVQVLAPRQLITATGYADLAQNANNAASATSAATATNALNLGGQPAANYLTTSATAFDSARLGGTLASGWQKALSPASCPANQFYAAIAQNGTASCASATITETDPKVGTLSTSRIPRWNGTALANGAFFDTGGTVALGGALPAAGNLLELNGGVTQANYNARLLYVDGTLRSDASAQAYLAGAVIAPTYDYTAGYGNYAWGLVVNAPAPVAGSQVVHSIVAVQGAQPTAGLECNVGFGFGVPNQQPSLCNGKYGIYLADPAMQYNYLGANLGIKNYFPGTELDVTGSGRASASFLSPLFASRSTGENLTVRAQNGAGSGGALTLSAGDASPGSGGAGGNLALTAGSAVPQGGSGYTNQGPAGVVTIAAGGGYNGVGGDVTLTSGPNSPWTLTGNLASAVKLQGGTLNAGDGAAITVEGGHNVSPAGTMTSGGGSVTITAGNGSAGTQPGGSITLTPGTGSPNGRVQVNGALSVGVRLVTCTISTPVQNCACAAGETVVSGGGYRAAGGDTLRASYPTSTTTWQIACTNSAGTDVNCGGMNIICARLAP